MGRKISFLHLEILPDVPKCKFILKSSSIECWLCFCGGHKNNLWL